MMNITAPLTAHSGANTYTVGPGQILMTKQGAASSCIWQCINGFSCNTPMSGTFNGNGVSVNVIGSDLNCGNTGGFPTCPSVPITTPTRWILALSFSWPNGASFSINYVSPRPTTCPVLNVFYSFCTFTSGAGSPILDSSGQVKLT